MKAAKRLVLLHKTSSAKRHDTSLVLRAIADNVLAIVKDQWRSVKTASFEEFHF